MGLIFFYYYFVPQCLQHLRIRTHNPLTWDERYKPFIHHAGFLLLARLVTTRGLPLMDSAALIALVDRWHPKTHTFHLPCGETTVMLHDIIMILGLPIDGTPVCGMVSSTGWRDSVGEAICIRPPPPNMPVDQIRRRQACTSGGSHLTSTPARRVLRTQSFRGMFCFVFDIWMMSDSLLT
jgi:hypothetical protein